MYTSKCCVCLAWWSGWSHLSSCSSTGLCLSSAAEAHSPTDCEATNKTMRNSVQVPPPHSKHRKLTPGKKLRPQSSDGDSFSWALVEAFRRGPSLALSHGRILGVVFRVQIIPNESDRTIKELGLKHTPNQLNPQIQNPPNFSVK